MIVGYHLIWTAYGWRGSGSHEIRVERLAELGDLHHGRKRVQPPPVELRRFYQAARTRLNCELLTFNEEDVRVIAESFARVVAERRYSCYACAIMPDHVHALIRRHTDRAETMIEQLQDASGNALVDAGRRPVGHPVWGGPGWKVFLETREDLERVIRYIRDNPTKASLPEQRWDFVKEYDGWMPLWRR
jgi:REP element-mobilizing transposase RayT